MKTLTKEIWMNVPQRRAIVSIHNEVERLVDESGVNDGFVLVNAMHITASVFIYTSYMLSYSRFVLDYKFHRQYQGLSYEPLTCSVFT